MNVKDKVAVVTGGAQRHRPRAVHAVRPGGRARRAVGPQARRPASARPPRSARFPSRPTSAARRTSRTSSTATVERFGRIDLFVSNAGIAIDGGIDTPTDGWQKIIDVNLMSEVFAAKYAIPHMLEQGSGYLLNVASAAGLLVIPDTVSLHGDQARRDRLHRVARGDVRRPGHRRQRARARRPCCTPILAGKEDTPEGQDAITTDELADIVMDGLAEERFMINTHPWVLEKFAVKARDYDEYIRMLQADRPRRAGQGRGGVSHAPRRHRRLRVRRAVRRQGAAPRAGRGGGGRPHQPPPLPAAALPGRHRECSPRATSRRRSATSCATSATRASCSARSSTSTSTTGGSRSTRWDARRRCPTTA